MLFKKDVKFINTYNHQLDTISFTWNFLDGFETLEDAIASVNSMLQKPEFFRYIRFDGKYYAIGVNSSERFILVAKDYLWDCSRPIASVLAFYTRHDWNGTYYPTFTISHITNTSMKSSDNKYGETDTLYEADQDLQMLDMNGLIIDDHRETDIYLPIFSRCMFDTFIPVYQLDSCPYAINYQTSELWRCGVKAINPYSGERIKSEYPYYFYSFYCTEMGLPYEELESQKALFEAYQREAERKKKEQDEKNRIIMEALDFLRRADDLEAEFGSLQKEMDKIRIACQKAFPFPETQYAVSALKNRISDIKAHRKYEQQRKEQEAQWKQREAEWKRQQAQWQQQMNSEGFTNPSGNPFNGTDFEDILKNMFAGYTGSAGSADKAYGRKMYSGAGSDGAYSNFQQARILSRTEQNFYAQLTPECSKLGMTVNPKVRLEDIIRVNSKVQDAFRYRNMIKSRHVDFVICDSFMNVRLAIELDDYTHNSAKAAETDRFKDQLFKAVGINLVRVKVKEDYSEDVINIIHMVK